MVPKKEPPYAEPHVRWCERSENESRKKTASFSSYSILVSSNQKKTAPSPINWAEEPKSFIIFV